MKKINKKTVLVGGVITILAVSAVFVYFRMNDSTADDNSYTVNQSEGINFNPPTEEEQQRADQNKQRVQEREDAIRATQQSETGEKQKVTPVFSYAGKYGTQIEIGSYVPGVFEDGGTCIAKFNKGDESFTRSVQAIKNVSSVDCPVIAVPINDFPSTGAWSVSITYVSIKASGSSDSKMVEVK